MYCWLTHKKIAVEPEPVVIKELALTNCANYLFIHKVLFLISCKMLCTKNIMILI